MNTCDYIITELIKRNITSSDDVSRVKREIMCEFGESQTGNDVLLATYRKMVKNNLIQRYQPLEKALQRAAIRSLSGVSVITVLTKPYACPGKCIYCPTESIMPKSYLSNEPAAQRAYRNKFDPCLQIANRIYQLEKNGHEVEKVELIIKGGTWNAYRYDYQLWFIRRCFEICNSYSGGELTETKDDRTETVLSNIDPSTTFTNVNSLEIIDAPSARTAEKISENIFAEEKLLENAQKQNETAKYRIIGLTLETRPDWIRPEEVMRMRKLGCTRVEVGLQHTDDNILTLIKRGHTLTQFTDGIALLRDAGFKVDFHTMPQLPGSTPEIDLKMYEQLFENSLLRPDMIKIYPCSVVPMSELYEWHKRGKYIPYSNIELFEMLISAKQKIPYYCRISRLIRDIPSDSIIAGNTITNLREYLQKEMKKRNVKCVCLRCREFGRQIKLHPELQNIEPRLFIEEYLASGGREFFLSFEDNERQTVFAFLRLRLSGKQNEKILSLMPETKDAAFIRELHTYGHIVPIDRKADITDVQHRGFGKKLMKKAEDIAREYGYKKMLVISGVGVRGYYAKLGFSLKATYMSKLL